MESVSCCKKMLISNEKRMKSSRTVCCRHCFNRTRCMATVFIVIITFFTDVTATVSSDHSSVHPSSRHRKSAPSNDDNLQSFECSDANSYLYHVLSQSKTARSLNSEPADSSSRIQSAIPQKAINGDHLKVCSQGFTCCTEEMESRLLGESKREFQKSVQDKIVGLSHTFESRTTKFDRFFRELISNARRDLHSMFLRTYGLLYEQNSDIFAALFDNLTHYYGNGPGSGQGASTGSNRVNLSRAIDTFYNTLYQRMFKILNQPYDFEPRYWQCMSGQMERLKPFGDVPANMKQQVQKAFIAARTFVQGLAAGRDVVRRMMELSPSNECTSGLMRMLYCPHCRGLSNVKPCSNFCLNVMKGCLAYQNDFDQSWNDYLDALLQLLSRLEGPFNIETVIDPIDVKISEAIMIFQDRGKEISDQIFSECGSPKVGPSRRHRRTRHKRESENTEQRPAEEGSTQRRHQQNRSGNSRSKQRQQKQQQQHRQFNEFLSSGSSPLPNNAVSVRPTTAAGTSLDRLSRELREKVQPAKGFWRHLPHTMCSDDRISPSTAANLESDKTETDCWNGLAKEKYDPPVVGDGPFSQVANPEVAVESGPSNNSVRELLSKLRTATAAMKKAYNGQEPDWRYSASLGTETGTPGQKSPAKENRRISASTPKPSQSKVDSIGPAVRDGSGDPFDDTEVFRPRPGSKIPKDTDDEELMDGSGSGDEEIPLPPLRMPTMTLRPTVTRGRGSKTMRPNKKPSGRVLGGAPMRSPVLGGAPMGGRVLGGLGGATMESTERIDLGDEDATTKGVKSTASTWASSEEAMTFEPVTSTPDPDDNEDSNEDDYDPELDGDSGWKEDDDGLAQNTTTTTLPATISMVPEMITEPSTVSSTTSSSTVITEPLVTSTVATTTSTSTMSTRKQVVTNPSRAPVVPSTKKLPAATTRKPTSSGASAIGLCSTSFFFLLAFYSALTLLWKRLCA